MKSVDSGKYNRDQKQYDRLVKELYDDYPNGITLPPEYAYFVKNDVLRILIRLARYKFIARMLRPTDTVLEVGCGSGLGSIFLSQLCRQVTGLDVKSTEIEEAKSINSRMNVDFITKDLFELEKTYTYDAVVALDVVEHYKKAPAKTLILEMTRHLKEYGIMILGTPSIYSYRYQSSFSKASHVKCYDQTELLALMDKYFGRTLAFSMNDELVHTGNPKMAWYYFVLGLYPKSRNG